MLAWRFFHVIFSSYVLVQSETAADGCCVVVVSEVVFRCWSGSVLLKLIHPVHLRGGGGEQGALSTSKGSSGGGVATGAGAALQETVQNTLGGGVGSKEHLA